MQSLTHPFNKIHFTSNHTNLLRHPGGWKEATPSESHSLQEAPENFLLRWVSILGATEGELKPQEHNRTVKHTPVSKIERAG